MKPRKIIEGVFQLGIIDWNRRLFDSLIPIPRGTSYNAYLIQGSEKVALLDTVEERWWPDFQEQLAEIPRIDYIISHHAEQDHSGSIHHVLEKYPQAKLLIHPKGKDILQKLIPLPEERVQTVADGETVSLGDRELQFIYLPWVHWPETMVTFLKPERILFSCDLFGAHLASSQLFAGNDARVLDEAKRYYAQIMMPYGALIRQHLKKIRELDVAMIAPSHGSVYDKPAFILEPYEEWTGGKPHNLVVIVYATMHGSVEKMVNYLAGELMNRGVEVRVFNLEVADLGEVAVSLVDAGTLVVGSPTFQAGAHPLVLYAAHLVSMLKPKAKFLGIVGSYSWSGKMVEQLTDILGGSRITLLEPVMIEGHPDAAAYQALVALADQIADRHREQGFVS